jgi:hypothetical protein
MQFPQMRKSNANFIFTVIYNVFYYVWMLNTVFLSWGIMLFIS